VCGVTAATDEENAAAALASHLIAEADASDGRHVMWLNRTVTKHRVDAGELADLLARWAGPGPAGDPPSASTDRARVRR
jgi:hypothetical protein